MEFKPLRTILLPFSAIYYLITELRNFLFDKGILHSKGFKVPVISIGNLAVGGTGKTPHTEFILSALNYKYKCAVLSRGYKRKTSGYVEADQNSDFRIIGDEPLQIFRKFENVLVAVDEKRINGIENINRLHPEIQTIILDDAFQHRYVIPGLSILLTCYDRIFTKDYLLPAGNLRESRKNFKRVDILIVTKCPLSLGIAEMNQIASDLKLLNHQQLFFSGFEYDDIQAVFKNFKNERISLNDIKQNKISVLIITGIASPDEMINKINEFTDKIESIHFRDHKDFSKNDIDKIIQKFNAIGTENKILLTTEKDTMRLRENKFIPENLKSKMYYLPVKVKILNNKHDNLIQTITDYVGKNTGNC